MWSMRTNLRRFEGLSWFCRPSDVCDNFPCSTEEKIKFGEDKLWTIDEPSQCTSPFNSFSSVKTCPEIHPPISMSLTTHLDCPNSTYPSLR